MHTTRLARAALAAAPLLALALAGRAAAQSVRVHDVPARPALWAGADTNSANVYYAAGVQALEHKPAEAAADFYWAARLAPGWADPLYARRIALLINEPRRLVDFMEGKRFTLRDRELLALDSLQLRARALDPFLHQKLDAIMLRAYLIESYAQGSESDGGTRGAANQFLADRLIGQATGGFRAWLAASEGRFPEAVSGYREEVRHARRDSFRPRAQLAVLHYLAGSKDSAIAQMQLSIADHHKADERDVVRLYESKALLEHSLGTVLRESGHAPEAREAFGRALQEDLAFWPSHVALGEMALEAGDTASALSEMALAVELAPAEPSLRHGHALLLLATGHTTQAVEELNKAVQLEPYYAAPHFVLGVIYQASGMPDEAATEFRAFLARAAMDDAQRGAAQTRLAAVAGGGATP